jgi:hypothetical protein
MSEFLRKLAIDLSSVGYNEFVITSYRRSSGSHSTGKAVDLVLRNKPLSAYPKVFYDISKLSDRYYIALSWPWNVHFHVTGLTKGLGMELHKPGRKPFYTPIQGVSKRTFANQYYIIYNNKEYNL